MQCYNKNQTVIRNKSWSALFLICLSTTNNTKLLADGTKTILGISHQTQNLKINKSKPRFCLDAEQNAVFTSINQKNIMPLKDKTTRNFLQGKINKEETGSPINTIQRKFEPLVQTHFTKLEILKIPDLFEKLKAQISKEDPRLDLRTASAIRPLAALNAKSNQPKPQIKDLFGQINHNEQPLAAVPDLAHVPNTSNKTIIKQKNDSKITTDFSAKLNQPRTEIKDLFGQINPNKQPLSTLPGLAHVPNISNKTIIKPQTASKTVTDHRAKSNQPRTAIKDLFGQINPNKQPISELAGLAHVPNISNQTIAKPQIIPKITTDLSAKLNQPRTEIKDLFGQINPNKQPLSALPDLTHASNIREQTILWDNWYAKFSKLSEPEIIRSLKKYGNPSGKDTISITVKKNHQVEVSLIKSNNNSFDKAILEAYKSLNGNAALEYPPGSQRQKVTFLIDAIRKNSGSISTINNQNYKGDKEVVKSQR